MTPDQSKKFLIDRNFKGGPENIKVGDLIDGNEIIEIKGLVNGKATYASTFICKKGSNEERTLP